ncbi:hypothetical protein GCM10018963_61000 [Saccharothrix longispora]
MSTSPHGSTTRSDPPPRPAYTNRTRRRPTTASSNRPTTPGRPRTTPPHAAPSTTTASTATHASSRNGSGNARTNFRTAPRTCTDIPATGPNNKNNARASDEVNPLRSVRARPTNRQPPPRPGCGYTGTPADDNASRSRRAVATDTSSSAANSAAVTRPRTCINNRAATNRSARMSPILAPKVLTR